MPTATAATRLSTRTLAAPAVTAAPQTMTRTAPAPVPALAPAPAPVECFVHSPIGGAIPVYEN